MKNLLLATTECLNNSNKFIEDIQLNNDCRDKFFQSKCQLYTERKLNLSSLNAFIQYWMLLCQ